MNTKDNNKNYKKGRHYFFLISFMLCSMTNLAEAVLIPRNSAADPHIKRVAYDPNNVVIIQGQYGYQTHIVFSPSESIQNISLGDSLAWQAVPLKNNLFLKPVAASKTNMTVLTNLNSYTFQLNSNDQSVSPTYQLQFIYPAAGFDQNEESYSIISCDPTKINWKYSFTGDKRLAPQEAFDCHGPFTYFRFKDYLPAIFVVDKQRQESLVNYHLKGNYVVVNTVASQFSFRRGNQVTSVYNDELIGDWKNIK